MTVLRLATSLACVGMLISTSPGQAQPGEITPPDGPVESTMLPLDQAEPRTPLTQETTPGDATAVFVITEPGSYFLTGNLVLPDETDGIRVEADGVTIDMRGFAIVLGNAFQIGNGIVSTSDALSVSNGSFFLDFNAAQVYAIDAAGSADLSNIYVYNFASGGFGGFRTGPFSQVDRCTFFGGNGFDIDAGAGSRLSDCISHFSSSGIRVGAECIVQRCYIDSTNANGLTAGSGSIIKDCVFSGPNAGSALNMPEGGEVIDCSFNDPSDGPSIQMGGPGRIVGCVLNGTRGINAIGDSTLISDTVVKPDGITCFVDVEGQQSRIEGCTFHETTLSVFGNAAVLSDCTVAGGTVNVGGEDVTVDGNTFRQVDWSMGGAGNVAQRNRRFGGIFSDDGMNNIIAPFRTDFSHAGPWDNFDFPN